MMDEHFIPYSMFESFMRDGMSGAELDRIILEKLGLSDDTHALVCYADHNLALAAALKQGLYVEPIGSRRVNLTNERWRHEPVR
jgi:hypothetical protein